MRHAIRFAKEIGALGMGLAGDDRFPELDGESDFFPELFDLKWPPEGRLIERDCTCDMWDRIRCKRTKDSPTDELRIALPSSLLSLH